MLASIEKYCLIDAGISLKLDEHLPNGTVVEGDWILSSSKLDKSIIEPNGKSLINALKHFVPHLSIAIDERNREKSVSINFKYQTLPEATNDDFKKELMLMLYLWAKDNHDFGYRQGMNEILAVLVYAFHT